ncbi:MAG: hypothetical protein K6E63_08540 [Lachnospiraceae bacterium]|nr:hypothetical protein [Lachnospiraceae bacterium]
MIKKVIAGALILLGFTAATMAVPRVAKADALPCTVMYLEQAKGMKAAAEAEVVTARAVLKDKQAKFNAFRAAGITTGMDYLNALSEMEAAQRNLDCKLSAVYNAENFIKDCQSKYAVEDNADKAYKALQDVNSLQAAKLDYDNALNIANSAAAALEETKRSIEGYKVQLKTSPSLQAQIDSLTVQLNAQQADLAAKQAVVAQKKAVLDKALNSGYASYNKKAIEYIYRRDDMRDTVISDLNGDGKTDGEDFFIAIGWK